MQLVYEGNGWLGLGFSPDGQMIGSVAAIGLPSIGGVWQYDLNEKVLSGIPRSDPQTITDATIDQNETHTILTYTQPVSSTLQNRPMPTMPFRPRLHHLYYTNPSSIFSAGPTWIECNRTQLGNRCNWG